MTSCGKVPYVDRRTAHADMRRAGREGKCASGHVYTCPQCGLFHITHYSKAEWRRLMRRVKR